MNTKSYFFWTISFAVSIAWYLINLGMMELGRSDPRIVAGVLFIFLAGIFLLVPWITPIKAAFIRDVATKKQRLFLFVISMGILWLFAIYQMFFILKEANIPLAQGQFFLWRAWMSYIGLLIVLLATLLNGFMLFQKQK